MPRSLLLDLEAADGLAKTADLRTLGYNRRHIALAVATSRLRRPRRGWIATAMAPEDAVRAVQLGGRLGGASALRSHGVWVDGDRELTVVSSRASSRLPSVTGNERRLWAADHFPAPQERAWRVSVPDALVQFARTASPLSFIASTDSALHHGIIRHKDLPGLADALPVQHREALALCDSQAMSGTESHLRILIRDLGLKVRSQVRLEGIGTVDLLVDDWLIVEDDSRSFHGSLRQQHNDRRRDGEAIRRGYGTVRFMQEQVLTQPDWCREVLLDRLSSGAPRGMY